MDHSVGRGAVGNTADTWAVGGKHCVRVMVLRGQSVAPEKGYVSEKGGNVGRG